MDFKMYQTADARNRDKYNDWIFKTDDDWQQFRKAEGTKDIFSGQPIIVKQSALAPVYPMGKSSKKIYSNFQPTNSTVPIYPYNVTDP